MSAIQFLIFLAVSFGASTVGAICGLGGGVIIKPVLDLVGCASAQTINFLSGCTVLAMSCYSVAKSVLAKEHRVQFAVGTPLAVGGCIAGGILGGMAGRRINKRINNAAVKKLYMGLMIVFIGICVFNTWKYLT